jgi:glycosyltransferase involved in cell wall biosynthesis
MVPEEIIVTDDGSREPFALPVDLADRLPPVRILRLPENRGITTAKQAGITTVTREAFLSADSDAQLHPDFLRRCCEHLRRPEIGMVGGNMFDASGTGALARYLRLFGDNAVARGVEDVDFLAGIAFAMRKAVWDEVGGLASHTRRTHEDHALCSRVKAHRYRIIRDAVISVTQTRKLTRHAMCMRIWTWSAPPLLNAIGNAPGMVRPALLAAVVMPMLQRVTQSSERGEPLLAYYDLLPTCHMALACCLELNGQGLLGRDWVVRLRDYVDTRCLPFPRLRRLLKSDLLRLGVWSAPLLAGGEPMPDGENGDPDPGWSEAFGFLDHFAATGLLALLEAGGIDAVLEEEREDTDFSSYYSDSE